MESIGTLAAGIAHDFNNILGIVLGYTALIQRTPQSTSEGIRAIKAAVQRGANLVKQILTFARKTDVSFGPIDLNLMIEEIAKMLRETISKTIDLSLELGDSMPLIHGDATQLHQVLLNLCVNARDAMPKGGTLSVRTDMVEGSELRKFFSDASDEGYAHVIVTDTGIGMDESTLSHIFDPFFTTKEKGKGTGLGLSVVYGVMKNHHGLMNVRSELGKGSAFHLYFPIPEKIEQVSNQSIKERDENLRGDETILVVEDEEALLLMAKVVLEANGYRVMSAMDGSAALEVYRVHGDEIALVLTDVGLPKLGGDQLLIQLKKINPAVRVILASGYFEPKAKTAAFKAGAKEFVQKPYDPAEILKKVRHVIDARQ